MDYGAGFDALPFAEVWVDGSLCRGSCDGGAELAHFPRPANGNRDACGALISPRDNRMSEYAILNMQETRLASVRL
jgi:hypothetical protein